MRSEPIDRASMARQFLAAAVNRAVDAGLPQLTPVDTGLPRQANENDEPTAPAARPSPFMTMKKSVATATAQPPPARPAAVDAGLQQLTPVDARLPEARIGKTNPPTPRTPRPRMSTLSPQQLAAARLLACGRSPAEVAAEIGISRQALWKWRGRADFDAEVFRLHECLTWTAGATAVKRR
jgi:DNA-binding CsgD family transcriptional regulator